MNAAPRLRRRWITAVVALAAATSVATGQELGVVAVSPAPHSLDAALDTRITVRFDRPIFGSSVDAASFWAFGRWSGPVSGRYEESFDGLTVSLVPDRRFSAGELVTVFLSHDLTAGDGTTLRAAGFSYQFWTRSRGAGFELSERDRFSTRSSPAVSTRAYGGFGSDLDGDGFLDLTIVNEDTNDLRTFLNRGDRSGRLRRFLRPPAAVGPTPSPSEPSDFNRDGKVDVAVANTDGDTVSILLGNGDGTFAPAAHVAVGGEPRGIAVLDADGDGDVDIAATSTVEGRVTLLLNDGSGDFAAARTLGAGGGDWALAAGDMNGDGILDLVVGDQPAGEIRVWAGAGNGEFELVGRSASGGAVWMLALGDVNADGDEDVAAVNSQSNSGAILFGDGEGGLSAPRLTATDDFPLATDLADLDGDGDLDWVTSSFLGSWALYENNGAGGFALAESFPAPAAASCSLPMDLDNDGVLDLVLIDELADEVVLLASRATIFRSDFETGDTREWSRTRGPAAVVTPGLGQTDHALAVRLDGSTQAAWVGAQLPEREPNLRIELLLQAARLDLAGRSVEILRVGGGRGQARLLLEEGGGRLRARLLARDGAAWRDVGAVALPVSRAVRLGVEWASAGVVGAAEGWASLAKKGRVVAVAADLDNSGRSLRRLRLGLPAGARGAVAGVLRLDEVEITR